MALDKNCLSTWFPRLVDAAIPVPRTEIVPTELDLSMILDGSRFDAGYRAFLRELAAAADSVGYPCFLRTGQTSGKHRWKRTCYIEDAENIFAAVPALVESSEMADIMGLPTNIWAVREYLPVVPVAVLPRYEDMPLVPEARCFIENGQVVCKHFYWPVEAIAQGLPLFADAGEGVFDQSPRDIAKASQLFAEIEKLINWDHVHDLAQNVANAFPEGYWSVDMIPARDQWWVTDMAEGERSFHFPGCEKAKS